MFNVILYVLTIKLSVANLQPVESVEECQQGCSEDCSTYTITMANNNCKLHIPEDCLNYEFDGKGHCDGTTFPKTCTFTLKTIPPANNNTTVDSFLSVKSRRKPKLPKPDQTNEEAMTQWATVAIGKAMLYFDTPCKPETVGKPAGRHMDCDACWAGIFPYPCNCNCRGWNQVLNLCFQPCHERLPYSYDSGLYCHKPCDQPGQNTNTVGCGLGHDRVCMKDSGACVSRHVMRAVDIAGVLMNVIPGLKAGFKGAKAAWTGAIGAGKGAGWRAAKDAMAGAAKEAAKKFSNTVGIDDAFKYMKGAKDRILEDAAVRFMAANPPNDDTDVLLEIAKMADPTGVVSMVAGWIPPASCDVQVCSVDDCEALTDVLPTYDDNGTEDTYIESKLNGMVLDIHGANKKQGAEVCMWSKNGGNHQKWTITSDGYIESKLNGMVLDIHGANKNQGAEVCMWSKNGGKHQKWIITSDGYIESQLNGMVLDIHGANKKNGAKVCMWSKNGGINQKWNVA